MTEPQPSAMRAALISMMVSIGILMIALCGSCTAFFTIGALVDLARGRSGGEFNAKSILMMAGVLGTPPTLIGVVLIWGGFRLGRRSRPPPSDPPPG